VTFGLFKLPAEWGGGEVEAKAVHGDKVRIDIGDEECVWLPLTILTPVTAEPLQHDVALDRNGQAWQRYGDAWYAPGQEDGHTWEWVQRYGPLTVIWPVPDA
jgi:hypothetical protein